ncbi:hypothetical protein [Candidatus Regiella insecticola]|nr:hypothetical protein [Candidatus Regiella insecticola]
MTNLNTVMKAGGFTGGVVSSPLSLVVDFFYRNLRKDKDKVNHELKITNRRDTEANRKVRTRMISDVETASGANFIVMSAPKNEALIENSIKDTRLPDDLVKILDAKDKTLDRTLDGAPSLSELMSSLRDNENAVSHNNFNRNVYSDSPHFLATGK